MSGMQSGKYRARLPPCIAGASGVSRTSALVSSQASIGWAGARKRTRLSPTGAMPVLCYTALRPLLLGGRRGPLRCARCAPFTCRGSLRCNAPLEHAVRAVIFHRHDDVRVEDIPTPSIGAGDILVRVAGCGLCGSDILKITAAADPPVSLGHELTGTVAASESSQFAPGERVVVAHHVPCGTCAVCMGGSPTMCDEFKASHLDPCGLAEYVRVSAAHVRQVVLPLPATLSDEAASFTEPLACCLRALGRARLNTVASTVVVGLGAMGLLMVQALLAMHTGTHVVGVDPIPERRELAVGLGAARAWAPGVALAAGTRQGAGARCADRGVLTTGPHAALYTEQTQVSDVRE